MSKHSAVPEAQGLFDPNNDKDACGVGFVAELSKQPSRKTVADALEMMVRMTHRGACGCEVNTGELRLPQIAIITEILLSLHSPISTANPCPCLSVPPCNHSSRPLLYVQVMVPASWWRSPISFSLRLLKRSAASSYPPW